MEYYNGTSYYGTTTITHNQWTHVAWVRSGSTVTFYVNGVSGGTATVSGAQVGNITSGLIYVGGSKDNANLTVERSPAIANAHDCRYLPVAVYAVVWLRTKFFFGNIFKALGRRAAALARSNMQRFSRGSNSANVKEMQRTLL